MSPKYGQRNLSREEREMKEAIIELQFDGRISSHGNERIDIDDAAVFATQQVAEAREAWDEEHAETVQVPNIEVLKAQEATKRTLARWRYGSFAFVAFFAMVTLAGLSATGHA